MDGRWRQRRIALQLQAGRERPLAPPDSPILAASPTSGKHPGLVRLSLANQAGQLLRPCEELFQAPAVLALTARISLSAALTKSFASASLLVSYLNLPLHFTSCFLSSHILSSSHPTSSPSTFGQTTPEYHENHVF